MSLRKIISLPLLLGLYLLALAGLGGYLFWPETGSAPLKVTRASLSPEGDRVLLEGDGFSEATQVSLSLDVNNRRFLRHAVPTYGRGADMIRVGGFAYVLVQKKGLVVFDLAEPQLPRVISTLKIPGMVWNLTVNEGVAYIACGRDGMVLVDVHDPSAPQLLATLPELQMVQGVVVRGGQLYAAVLGNGVSPGLAIADISDPRRPRLIGRVPLPGKPLGVALWGQNVLVAAGNAGLICLKLGDGLPQVSALLPLPGSAQSLVVKGYHAYVACTLGGLAVIDMATGDPQLQAHLPLPGRPTRLVVEGERLYLCSFGEGGHVIDIHRPSQPMVLGTFDLSGGLASMAALNSTLYLNTTKDGVRVVDMGQPTLQQDTNQGPLGEVIYGISQEGDLIAVSTQSGRLYLYNRRPGVAPSYLSTLQFEKGRTLEVALVSGYAYIRVSNVGLTVVDVRDPLAPVPVGHYPFEFERGDKTPANDFDRFSTLAISGSRGALVDDYGQLWLFDTNQPNNLQLQAGPAIPEPVTRIVWGEECLYVVSASQSIRAIDFRKSHSPVVLPALSLPAKVIEDVALIARTVVLACGLEGGLTVDFENPAAPRLVTALPLPIDAHRLRVEGTTAYIGDRRGGFLQVDMSDPASPRFGGLLTDAGAAEDFSVSGNQALVAAGPGGLMVVPLPQALQPVDRNKREMSLDLPAIDTSGHYTLRVTDGERSVVLPGVLALAPR